MNEEIKILDIIRRAVLNTEDIAGILNFASEQPRGALTYENSAGMHLHDQFEMRILFAADSTMAVDYNRISEICLTPPQLPHKGLPYCDLQYHLALLISADEIYYLRGANNVIALSLAHDTDVPGVDYAELVAVLGEGRNFKHDPEHVRILIALLLSALRWRLNEEKMSEASPAEIIASSIRSCYYRSDLSIREIAGMTRFSPNYIQKVFRAGYNCTPIEYLNGVRLNAARQLLRQHRWQIKEVSAMCGFNYAHYFCRRYKEHFGILPSEE